jgi:hypothetical protein
MEKEDARYSGLILNIYMQTRMYLVIENNNLYKKISQYRKARKSIFRLGYSMKDCILNERVKAVEQIRKNLIVAKHKSFISEENFPGRIMEKQVDKWYGKLVMDK